MKIEGAGEAPKPAATHTVAVYDPSDGSVAHLHHVVVFEGAKEVDVGDAEQDAVENAKRNGLKVEELRTMRITEPLPTERGLLRVDVESGRLVSEKRQP